MEINTVYYDPSKITIKDIEKALSEAGTYEKTIQIKQNSKRGQ